MIKVNKIDDDDRIWREGGKSEVSRDVNQRDLSPDTFTDG